MLQRLLMLQQPAHGRQQPPRPREQAQLPPVYQQQPSPQQHSPRRQLPPPLALPLPRPYEPARGASQSAPRPMAAVQPGAAASGRPALHPQHMQHTQPGSPRSPGQHPPPAPQQVPPPAWPGSRLQPATLVSQHHRQHPPMPQRDQPLAPAGGVRASLPLGPAAPATVALLLPATPHPMQLATPPLARQQPQAPMRPVATVGMHWGLITTLDSLAAARPPTDGVRPARRVGGLERSAFAATAPHITR